MRRHSEKSLQNVTFGNPIISFHGAVCHECQELLESVTKYASYVMKYLANDFVAISPHGIYGIIID